MNQRGVDPKFLCVRLADGLRAVLAAAANGPLPAPSHRLLSLPPHSFSQAQQAVRAEGNAQGGTAHQGARCQCRGQEGAGMSRRRMLAAAARALLNCAAGWAPERGRAGKARQEAATPRFPSRHQMLRSSYRIFFFKGRMREPNGRGEEEVRRSEDINGGGAGA